MILVDTLILIAGMFFGIAIIFGITALVINKFLGDNEDKANW